MIPSCGVHNSLISFVCFLFVVSHCVFCFLIWFNYLVYWFAPLSQVSVVQIPMLLAFIHCVRRTGLEKSTEDVKTAEDSEDVFTKESLEDVKTNEDVKTKTAEID